MVFKPNYCAHIKCVPEKKMHTKTILGANASQLVAANAPQLVAANLL